MVNDNDSQWPALGQREGKRSITSQYKLSPRMLPIYQIYLKENVGLNSLCLKILVSFPKILWIELFEQFWRIWFEFQNSKEFWGNRIHLNFKLTTNLWLQPKNKKLFEEYFKKIETKLLKLYSVLFRVAKEMRIAMVRTSFCKIALVRKFGGSIIDLFFEWLVLPCENYLLEFSWGNLTQQLSFSKRTFSTQNIGMIFCNGLTDPWMENLPLPLNFYWSSMSIFSKTTCWISSSNSWISCCFCLFVWKEKLTTNLPVLNLALMSFVIGWRASKSTEYWLNHFLQSLLCPLKLPVGFVAYRPHPIVSGFLAENLQWNAGFSKLHQKFQRPKAPKWLNFLIFHDFQSLFSTVLLTALSQSRS